MASNVTDKSNVFEEGGGWMPSATHVFTSYRSKYRFRIEYREIVRHDKKGSAVTKLIDSINIPNNPKQGLGYYILGYYYCKVPYKDTNLVIALSGESVVKTWTIVNNKFRSVSTKGIKCDLARLRE